MQNKLVAALALLGTLVFISSASAGYEVHPGSMCRVVSGGTPTLYYSAIGNSGTTPMSIDCPIVRPSGTIFTGMSSYTASNWPFSGALNCTLVAAEFGGSMSSVSIWSSGPKYLNNFSGTPTYVAFGPVTPSIYAYAYMNCVIPPATSGGNISYLISYTPYIQ